MMMAHYQLSVLTFILAGISCCSCATSSFIQTHTSSAPNQDGNVHVQSTSISQDSLQDKPQIQVSRHTYKADPYSIFQFPLLHTQLTQNRIFNDIANIASFAQGGFHQSPFWEPQRFFNFCPPGSAWSIIGCSSSFPYQSGTGIFASSLLQQPYQGAFINPAAAAIGLPLGFSSPFYPNLGFPLINGGNLLTYGNGGNGVALYSSAGNGYYDNRFPQISQLPIPSYTTTTSTASTPYTTTSVGNFNRMEETESSSISSSSNVLAEGSEVSNANAESVSTTAASSDTASVLSDGIEAIPEIRQDALVFKETPLANELK